ncbi:MAG: tRNA pseudouridine(38-40) synthase TruA [Bacteroidales bacterium]|nr:tRNA pseudouridine(38-40) synthase TruA [Bacteroidales bacterium]
MRLFVSLAYDGSNYAGWQRQDNALSVQQVLEEALSTVLSEKISVTGAGRTDAGVSASCYYAHFDTVIEIKEPKTLLYKLNAITPADIVINCLYKVADDAHARFDATSRSYSYRLHTVKDPFAHMSSYCKFDLDMDAMNEAAGYLIGEQDFSSLEKTGGNNATSICRVTRASWQRTAPCHYVFNITANRFLRNMVRAAVGTLLEVGRHRQQPEWVAEVLAGRDRCSAGQSAPAVGLTLTDITYPYPLIALK